MSRDPSAVSPSIRPKPDSIAWATDGVGHTGTSGTTTIVPGCDPPIIATATSTCIGWVMIGYVAPTIVGATSVVGSPVRPIVGSSVATIVRCSVIFEGAPWTPMSAHPTKGKGTTMGSACLARGMVTLAPPPPKMGTAPVDGCRLSWQAMLFFGANAKGLRCLSTL